jgi:outer membrane protein OmpA-like peptidoglycan-associated protein
MTSRSSLTISSCLLCALVALFVGATPARAQGRFDVETFEPAPAAPGSVLNVQGARTLAPLAYSVSLMGSYGRTPLSVESPSGARLGDLVGSVSTVQVLFALGLHDRIDLGIAVPLHRVSAGSDFAAPPPAVAAAVLDGSELSLGDVRLVPRLTLYRQAREQGLAIALLTQVWLPTGNDRAYAGEPIRVEPRLALDYRTPRAVFAWNGGYMVRTSAEVLGTKVDDQLRLGAGADVTIHGGLGALAEVDAQLNVLSRDFDQTDAAVEALAGLRFKQHAWLARLGAGPGIVRGLAAPAYRIFASVTFSAEPTRASVRSEEPRDQDGDGMADTRDACPSEREDRDGFVDADGCPDPDNDGDGVLDASDRCQDQAEDLDSFEDLDGCPDEDDDHDGVPDASDRCPRVAGRQTEQGCPEQPKAPPAPAEADAPAPPSTVYFRRNDVTLDDRAQAALDAFAQYLAAHPEIERVLVEGHTDAHGAETLNSALSERRAKVVVNALVARGVARSRLVWKALGASRPASGNAREQDRARNRRAELHVVSQGTTAHSQSSTQSGPRLVPQAPRN